MFLSLCNNVEGEKKQTSFASVFFRWKKLGRNICWHLVCVPAVVWNPFHYLSTAESIGLRYGSRNSPCTHPTETSGRFLMQLWKMAARSNKETQNTKKETWKAHTKMLYFLPNTATWLWDVKLSCSNGWFNGNLGCVVGDDCAYKLKTFILIAPNAKSTNPSHLLLGHEGVSYSFLNDSCAYNLCLQNVQLAIQCQLWLWDLLLRSRLEKLSSLEWTRWGGHYMAPLCSYYCIS